MFRLAAVGSFCVHVDLKFILSIDRVLIVLDFFVHVHKEQLKINYILQLIFVPAFFLLNHCIILPFPKEDVVGFT